MIKKGFLLALFAIGVFANIFAQDTLSFKKTRDKNIYIEFLGASNLIGVSFDSRFTPISPWGYRIGISYFQGGDSFIKASNSNRGITNIYYVCYCLIQVNTYIKNFTFQIIPKNKGFREVIIFIWFIQKYIVFLFPKLYSKTISRNMYKNYDIGNKILFKHENRICPC